MPIYKLLAIALGLGTLATTWWYGASIYPSIILPSMSEVGVRLVELLSDAHSFDHIQITTARMASAFVAVLVTGIGIGILAGLYAPLGHFMLPFEHIMISVPPIAWIVLALIWFGGDGLLSVSMTVFVSTFPSIYMQSVQGVRTIDKRLLDMGKSFGMSPIQGLMSIGFMHILSHIYPVLVLVFGQSFKIAVMAEVLGASKGIGSQIALARVNLETVDVMAWIAISVVLYVLGRRVLIAPLDYLVMRWRP